jgi:hypothetical protein
MISITCLPSIVSSLEQGLARDRAGDARRGERCEIAGVAYAARRHERDVGPTAHAVGVQLEVRADERAVAVDVRAEHVPQPGLAITRDRVGERQRRVLRPAVRCDVRSAARVEPNVERKRQALGAELREPARHERLCGHDQAADDGPVDDLEGRVQRFAIAQTAAELHA